MPKSGKHENHVDVATKEQPRKRRINFKRMGASARTAKNEKEKRRISLWERKHWSAFKRATVMAAGRPVNQRYRELQESDSLSKTDPIRPSLKHQRKSVEREMINEEVDALQKFIRVNMFSIARRTSEPEELIWPLMHSLANLITEFIDEKSNYEMGTLEDALSFLELCTQGKVRFARAGD